MTRIHIRIHRGPGRKAPAGHPPQMRKGLPHITDDIGAKKINKGSSFQPRPCQIDGTLAPTTRTSGPRHVLASLAMPGWPRGTTKGVWR